MFVVALACVAALSGAVAGNALACDTNYWNIPSGVGCKFYSSGQGHSEYEFGDPDDESLFASWDTYSSVKFFATTAGGSWTGSVVVIGSPNGYRFTHSFDKVGCHNHHTGTMWVNCRHYDP